MSSTSNFEKLNSDEKMLILMKLDSKEILKVCATSKDLSRVCNDSRYNPLWYQKIKQDFNISYNKNKGYEEYKRLFMLLHTEIFTVTIADTNAKEYFSELFLTREDAENYIFATYFYNNEYAKIKNSLKYINSYEYAENIYTISKTYIQKKGNILNMRDELLQKLEEEKNEYARKTEEFYNLFNGMRDKDDIISDFKQLIDDSITDMQGKTYYEKEDYRNFNVQESVKELIRDYDLQEYEQEITYYVRYNL